MSKDERYSRVQDHKAYRDSPLWDSLFWEKQESKLVMNGNLYPIVGIPITDNNRTLLASQRMSKPKKQMSDYYTIKERKCKCGGIADEGSKVCVNCESREINHGS